ncbi:MAG: Stk1 family PASTA domain-containing Ser/Thr kinase [Propionicimonas sp.]|nr:Stk1 family PASTA domain-containing Ser/Thr kinase [Propionicimonas sp.]
MLLQSSLQVWTASFPDWSGAEVTIMSSSDALVGRVLDGRYEILRKLARGGMATVYLASDRRLTRTVAVKVMHESLGGDAEFVTRFDREARAAARLSHPNVVSVFDQGIDDGRPYIVMEYVEGQTLRHVITREAPMRPERALELLLPVITAVAAAHEAGIIHRDLKPENVLISDRGQTKVADFGLARAVTAATATQTGTLIGTVSYIAPELVTTGKGNTRCDVYALGVVLFEMLTGRKPHTGETPIQVAYSHVHNEIPSPSSQLSGAARAAVPAYLDALVTSAAAREQRNRPADATVLLDHAREALGALTRGITDDPALTARMRVASLDPATQVTEPVPVMPLTGPDAPAVNRTATLRFTPSTPVSPGQPPVSDGMPYYDVAVADSPSPTARQLRQRQERRRRRGIVLLSIVLLLTAALGTGAWWMFSGRFIETPDFASLTQPKAEQLAKDQGLQISFENDYDEAVKVGQVIRTNPVTGTPIVRGSTVTAYLSKGPERYPVPKLIGLTESGARQALEENHLALGKVTAVYHDTAEEGTIVKASIDEGEQVKRNTVVDVKISKGPAPVEIVSFVNKPFDQAKKYYEDAGLKVLVADEVFSDKVDKDAVISSDPAKGTLLRGQTISFTVSKGPELVKVPYVGWKSLDDAKAILKKAGFKVKVEYREPNLFNLVAWSNPKNGESVPKGSTITLTVG